MAKKSSHASEIRSKLAEALDNANQGTTAQATADTDTMSAAAIPATASASSLSAKQIVTGSMFLAAGAGAVPVPLWDTALVTGVQIKMLSDLSSLYGVPFKENIGKTAIATLLGGMAPGLIAQGTFSSIVKSVPGIGGILGLLTQPALAAAVTYAIGQVFIRHYESGGTMLNFSAADFKTTFTQEVKAGMKKVTEIKI